MKHLHRHLKPQELERYAFMWSEARLVVAAIALLIGGVPPIYLIAPPAMFDIARTGLFVAWILSGITSLYLFFLWWQGGQKVFGKRDRKDMVAFLVLVVSGVNLGLTAVLGSNYGMSILSGRFVFFVTAVVYLLAAYHLYARWKSHGGKLF
jgi:small-conductance mechanosensitive channel